MQSKVSFLFKSYIQIVFNNSVSLILIYLTFNDYGLSWSNRWHSVLALPNMNTIFTFNVPQEYTAKKYVIIFGDLLQSVSSD